MRTFLHFSVRPIYVVALFGVFALAVVAMRSVDFSVGYLSKAERTNGAKTLAAFSEITRPAAKSVVEIVKGDEVVALGTVVSPLGYVVTKRSEVGNELRVRLPDGSLKTARILATDIELDLALTVVPDAELRSVRWGRSEGVRIGDWVVSPGQESRSWVGVISAKRREIRRVGGALGVRLSSRDAFGDGVEIIAVLPQTPAEAAGLVSGDRVLKVGERFVSTSSELISSIQEYDPGDRVLLEIVRGRERRGLEVKLGFYSIFDELNRNQRMSGETSDRRNGFPEVIQHAIPLAPNAMGSPLLNLRGETIGINIARADRVTTYSIPAERVMVSVRSMVSQLRQSQQ